jgi:dTDP-4-dehydrorhamnose reductase
MLGHKLWQMASTRFETKATVRSARWFVDHGFAPESVISPVDISDLNQIVRAFAIARPDVVVNCIGVVKQLAAAKDPLASISINSLLPHQLAGLCAATGARLIHLSTDCVFSGRKGMYTEADQSDAEDLYGRSKFLGEVGGPGCLTLRTSIIGRELERGSGLLEWFARTEERRVNGFVRAIFSGVTTTELARFVARALREHQELAGLWHLAADPIDKFDLLLRLRAVLGIERAIVPVDEPVINRALDASRLERATGYRPPDWDTMLGELAATHG